MDKRQQKVKETIKCGKCHNDTWKNDKCTKCKNDINNSYIGNTYIMKELQKIVNGG